MKPEYLARVSIPLSMLLILAMWIIPAVGRSTAQSSRHPAATVSHQPVTLRPCRVPGLDKPARCGSYPVYEDRAAQTGRKINLHIVIVPATQEIPEPDPAFWLHGGPGAASTDLAANVDQGFLAGVHKTRDLVFVDQRGTGESNPLRCSLSDNARDLQSFFGDLFPPDKVRECRQTLEKNADLRLYTTPIAMDDLDEVRAALGYDRINLIAGSYGTIAAQVYMRQHPEHLRSVFMLGVAAPGFKQPLSFARGAQNALDQLFRDCAADPACHAEFPDLQKEFQSVLDRFDHGSVEAGLVRPDDKSKQVIRLARINFVERIRFLLYTNGGSRFVPFLIHRAYQNDYLPFEALALAFNPGQLLSRGMYMSVTCSEGVPFITTHDISTETQSTFLGPWRVRAHMAACKEWTAGKVPQGYTDFVRSEVPVLLVSGDLDAASPFWFGEAVVKHFPHGRLIRVSHVGHEFDGTCIPDILTQFINKGSPDGIDAACTEKLQRPPFATQLPKNLSLE
jgi:pimeloyl-ACP methyl ester carboxylesterase